MVSIARQLPRAVETARYLQSLVGRISASAIRPDAAVGESVIRSFLLHADQVQGCFSLDSLNKRAKLAATISDFELVKGLKNNMIYRKLCAAGTTATA